MNKYPNPSELLPHEEPILFIDRIVDYKPGFHLIGEKYVDKKNPFFKGHFRNYPLLPGVILVEALFQTCSLFNRMSMLNNFTGNKEFVNTNSGRAIKIDKFVFKEEVRPDTTLILKVRLKNHIFKFSTFIGEVFVNDKIIAVGELTTFIKKN